MIFPNRGGLVGVKVRFHYCEKVQFIALDFNHAFNFSRVAIPFLRLFLSPSPFPFPCFLGLFFFLLFLVFLGCFFPLSHRSPQPVSDNWAIYRAFF